MSNFPSPLFGFDLQQKNTLIDQLKVNDLGRSVIDGFSIYGAPAEFLADITTIKEQLNFTTAFLSSAIYPLAFLPVSDPGDGVTIWNDAGVLKVASGP